MEPTTRREQIVMTALSIISKEGVKKLTMKNIADKMEFTDAALYRHYKNKKEIMKDMIETTGRKLTSKISNSISSIDDPVEKLKKVLYVHLNYLEENKGIPRLIFSEDIHQNDPILRKSMLAMVTHYLDLIRGILLRAKENGHIKSSIDIEAKAISFLGLVQTMAFLWSLQEFEFSISSLAPDLWQTFADGLV